MDDSEGLSMTPEFTTRMSPLVRRSLLHLSQGLENRSGHILSVLVDVKFNLLTSGQKTVIH